MTNISDILKFWNRHRFCLFKTRSSFFQFWSVVFRCFPNPRRVTADWSVGCCCSPSKSLCILLDFSKMNQLKKLVHCSSLTLTLSLSFSLSLTSSLSPSPIPPPTPTSTFSSLPKADHQVPLGLMDVVEPVDNVEEGEDGREDHPGPLVDRVHVGQVWDVHLELGGPSP